MTARVPLLYRCPADAFARHDDLDATVLLSSVGSAVVCNRVRIGEPGGFEVLFGHTLTHQILRDSIGTLLR